MVAAIEELKKILTGEFSIQSFLREIARSFFAKFFIELENTKVKKFIAKEQDCLKYDWSTLLKSENNFAPFIWCNPPYSKIGEFVKKAYEESLKGCTVVMLIPSRTDTKYWHDYCVYGQIRYVRGRLKFGNSKNSAPFPSCIVVFSRRYNLLIKEDLTMAQHFYIKAVSIKNNTKG